MSSIENRLKRLEGQGRHCPDCGLTPDGPGRIAVINEEHPETFDGDPDERCARCGRPLYTVIRVIYGDEEGGGGRR